jgi:hypothetical protein
VRSAAGHVILLNIDHVSTYGQMFIAVIAISRNLQFTAKLVIYRDKLRNYSFTEINAVYREKVKPRSFPFTTTNREILKVLPSHLFSNFELGFDQMTLNFSR